MTEVSDLIEKRAIRIAFQPVVWLDTREVVAYQAVARGPAGTRWRSPGELSRAAAAAGRTAELDWICRATSCQAASRRELPPLVPLLIAGDPATTGTSCPADLRAVLDQAAGQLTVLVELTERAVSVSPLSLIMAGDAARVAGFGVALTRLGIDPGSLALLPLLRPDIVKIDGYLLRHPERLDTVRVATAVAEYAEWTGVRVLADGIETERDLACARSLGATLGQGDLLGAPGPLPERLAVPLEPLRIPPGAIGGAELAGAVTPYDVVAVERQVTLTDKANLLATARRLEAMACDDAWPSVVLGCFQDAAGFAAATGCRYPMLADHATLVAVFGADLVDEPAAGVLGVRLDPGHPLCDEWNLIVLGPRHAAALVARDLGDAGPDPARRYVHAVSYDRELVAAAARSLLGCLVRSRPPETGWHRSSHHLVTGTRQPPY